MNNQERWDKHISAWSQLIMLELLTWVYITKLSLVTDLLQDSTNLISSRMLSSHYQTSVLTLFFFLLFTNSSRILIMSFSL